jgi:hypothetical protein
MGEEKVEGDQKVSKWSSEGVELAVAGFNYGDFKAKELKDADTGLNLEVYANRVLPDEIKDLQQRIEQLQGAGSGGATGTTLGSLNTASMLIRYSTRLKMRRASINSFFGKLPYKRVAMTQQPAINFGQAWPSLVFMPYTAFFDDTYRVQIFGMRGGTDSFWHEVGAHEVAHQMVLVMLSDGRATTISG